MRISFQKFVNKINNHPDPFEEKFLQADYIQKLYKENFDIGASITKEILINGDDSMSFFKRGLSLLVGVGERLGQNQLDLAMGDFNYSIILDSENPLPYYGQAKVWYFKNDLAESIDYTKRAIKLSSNLNTTIDFGFFLEYLLKQRNESKTVEYNLGKHGNKIKTIYETIKGIDSDERWILIDWKHRFKIRTGSVLRSYKQSYNHPKEVWMEEFTVTKAPHSTVGKYKWARGLTYEKIGFELDKKEQTESFFRNEIWIRKDTLKFPFARDVKIDQSL